MKRILIVGASLAGGRAVEALRQEGFDGEIILVGEETYRPYERPPLSKAFMRSEVSEDSLYLQSDQFYDDNEVKLILGKRAVELHPRERVLVLNDGNRITYDSVLLCTGATPKKLEVSGSDLDGIFYLRSLDDAGCIRSEAGKSQRVVLVGSGFIVCELAASFIQMGLEVTIVGLQSALMKKAFGQDIGATFTEVHRSHGVQIHLEEHVTGFRGAGKVEQVITSSGKKFDCDFVVVGIGVTPACSWLASSGVKMSDGVLIDDYCRASIPGVFAAGDVARWFYPRVEKFVRAEHYDNAQNQGVAAARSILGKGESYSPVLFFWSDQYDLHIQYVGYPEDYQQIVLRGDKTSSSWCAFYILGDRLVATLAVNRPRELSVSRRIISRGIPIDPKQLADEQFELRSILGSK